MTEKPSTQRDILQELYESEINFEMSCFWDGGIDWKLGDEMNGFNAKGCADTVPEAIQELNDAALEHFPDSQFAKKARG